jgi:hypothetical protein
MRINQINFSLLEVELSESKETFEEKWFFFLMFVCVWVF